MEAFVKYYSYLINLKEKKDNQKLPENIKEQKDIIETIIERIQLQDFLSVPAPDILHRNAFWHNENGNPIDCNIYHPKYGYRGFETNTNEQVIASFQPVTGYKDEKSGK